MLYMIRNWNKVESGVYDSDQKTFDYNSAKYIALFRIEKSYGTWTIYKAVQKDADNEDAGMIYTPIAPEQKTLKDAKAVAEDLFGVQYNPGDFEEAMMR